MEQLKLSEEELKQYDGRDGNPAYIAVEGVIYDVSDIPSWEKGSHHGYRAGADLSMIFNVVAPHLNDVLSKAKVVGELVKTKQEV